MLAYAIRRLGQSFFVLLVMSLLVFLGVYAIGNPVELLVNPQADEVERLKGLGATEVHWSKRPANADYVILADPEGNRFCVIDAGPRA